MQTNVTFVTARNRTCSRVPIKILCSILKHVVVNYGIRVNYIFSLKHLHYLSCSQKHPASMLPKFWSTIPLSLKTNYSQFHAFTNCKSVLSIAVLQKYILQLVFWRYSGCFNSDGISVCLPPLNKAVLNTEARIGLN